LRLIVYNPSGGAAIWTPRLREALRVLQSLPGPHALVATEATDMVGPVRRALTAHPDTTQVVACGGDGTVAAAAAAVGSARIPIAIVPTGTSNVLAFELGLPSHAVAAARLLAGPMRPVSFRTWSVNRRFMLLQLGVGFDGKLLWGTPRRLKRALGFVGVVASALRHGVRYDYPPLRVTGELESGATRSFVVTSAMIANAKRWAGPQVTVPAADPGDDLLDVLLLTYRSFSELARFWIAILFPGAPHLRLPFVEHVQMRRLRVEGIERPVEAHLDGEPVLVTPLEVEPLGFVTLLGNGEAVTGKGATTGER
jgi:diacylglycerol kinase family enzyme